MSRFREELKVIPRAARVIVAVIWLIYAAIFWFVVRHHGWLVTLLFPLFLSAYVLLVGYVNGDARRRGMRYVLWTLLAIFIPNAIGIILYFVMRDPLMRNCPKCSATIGGGFAYCPKCGSALSKTCPNCHRAVEPDWSHCAGCGTSLN
jgi:RNA polymerase subunit RPABC4/transcription elongation factor Spt4